MKVRFSVPKGCSCRSFMKEIFPQVNTFRKTLGRRKISMSTFYKLRRDAAEEWLDERISRYPKNPNKWSGNPFLASGRNGGYVFSQKHANAIFALAVGCTIAKPRGRQVAAKRANQLVRC
jgi:hypothetical protein